MSVRSFLTATTAALVMMTSAVAQGSPEGEITVTTKPSGALVSLRGEVVLSGISPVRFHQPLIGDYQLVVEKRGFERHHSHVLLDPTQSLSFEVTLSAKTRLKAAVRSLLIPGWGQAYTDQPGKAATLAVLGCGSVLAYLFLDHRFDDRYDKYENARTQYEAAVTTYDKQRLWPRLVQTQNDAYDAENWRRGAIGVVVGVWAAGVLDALLFHPRASSSLTVKSLAVQPEIGWQGAGLSLGTRF